jgi:hypothetical protein
VALSTPSSFVEQIAHNRQRIRKDLKVGNGAAHLRVLETKYLIRDVPYTLALEGLALFMNKSIGCK